MRTHTQVTMFPWGCPETVTDSSNELEFVQSNHSSIEATLIRKVSATKGPLS